MNEIKTKVRSLAEKPAQLRREGWVPACISVPGAETLAVKVCQAQLASVLRRLGRGSVLQLQLPEKTLSVLIREISREAGSEKILHLDAQLLIPGHTVNNTARVVVKNREKLNGTVLQLLHEIPYTALPEHLVDTVVVDLAGRGSGTNITVGDLPLAQDAAITVQLPRDRVVINVTETRRGTPVA